MHLILTTKIFKDKYTEVIEKGKEGQKECGEKLVPPSTSYVLFIDEKISWTL